MISKIKDFRNDIYIVVDEVFRNLALITVLALLIRILFAYTLPFDLRMMLIPLIIFGVTRICLK